MAINVALIFLEALIFQMVFVPPGNTNKINPYITLGA